MSIPTHDQPSLKCISFSSIKPQCLPPWVQWSAALTPPPLPIYVPCLSWPPCSLQTPIYFLLRFPLRFLATAITTMYVRVWIVYLAQPFSFLLRRTFYLSMKTAHSWMGAIGKSHADVKARFHECLTLVNSYRTLSCLHRKFFSY